MALATSAKVLISAAIISAASAGKSEYVPSHIRLALSGICSSTSLACWIVLLLPQLIEQWRLKSSEGISPVFIGIWFLGDIFNLIGAIWAGLLPGVVLLALWFCLTDALMFASYFYYRGNTEEAHHHRTASGRRRRSTLNEEYEHGAGIMDSDLQSQNASSTIEGVSGSFHGNDSTRPLLDRRSSETNYTDPSSRRPSRRSSRRKSSKRIRRDSLASIIDKPTNSTVSIVQRYILPLAFVIGAGVVGYLFSNSEVPDVSVPGDDNPNEPPTASPSEIGPELLGYISAVLYLGARIPQIIQNYKKKSVYGLSLLFFLFSILGNFTYSGGILFYRSDAESLELYLPWLLGSLGTVFEDLIIIVQFWVYGPYTNPDLESAIED